MYATSDASFSPRPVVSCGPLSVSTEPVRQIQQTQPKFGKGRQKLRMSCDECASAKVRCSKDHPKCERCSESNISCVYGPSMKHGKGSQKRRKTESQPAIENFQSPLGSSQPQYHNDFQRSFSELLHNIDSTGHPFSPQSGLASNQKEFTSMILPQARTTSISPSVDDHYENDIMNHRETKSVENGDPSFTNPYPIDVQLGSFDDTLSLISHMDFSDLINSKSAKIMSSPSTTPFSSEANINGSFAQASMPAVNSGKHNCYIMANSTLTILNVLKTSSPYGDGSNQRLPTSATSDRGPTQGVQSLDDVLRCTRDAMSNVNHLLQCPCARDAHMAMLDASIIMRILFWHQIAAGIRTSSSFPLNSASSNTAMDATGTPTINSTRNPCSMPPTVVTSEPVRLGSYVPDYEDQELVQRLLLLISLKKLKQLIDKFTQIAAYVDAGPSHLHSILAPWLDSELSQAIKKVGKGRAAVDLLP